MLGLLLLASLPSFSRYHCQVRFVLFLWLVRRSSHALRRLGVYTLSDFLVDVVSVFDELFEALDVHPTFSFILTSVPS